MKSNNTKPNWGAMSADELAEATKEFDRPLPMSRLRPLTKAERARFERARRAGTRGRQLMHALKLDPKLVLQAEAYAKRKRLTWVQLLEQGLRRELAIQD